MRAELVLQTIKDLFPTKRPLSIIGAPGGGKTSLVRRGSQELAIGYIEKHMPTMLVEDFGIPDVATDGENFGYKIPSWYPAEGRDDIPDEGILSSMIVTKQVMTYKKSLLTSNKPEHYTVFRSRKVGWLCLLATVKRTEQVLIVCFLTSLTARLLSNLRHTLMTQPSG